jgi:hypothetical protein
MGISNLRPVTLALSALLAFAGAGWAQQNAPLSESAKKEGEVIWYGTLTGGSIVGRLLSTFESKYPPIKVQYLRLGGSGF